MTNKTIFVASPGTGKTTRLIGILEELLQNDVKPEEIAYTTFTRAGAHEARDRAIAKCKLPEDRFCYFNTLHALAYRNTPHIPMLRQEDLRHFGRTIGYKMSGYQAGRSDYSSAPAYDCKGDTLANLYGLMRARCETVDQFTPFLTHYPWITKEVFIYFIKSYEAFKKETSKIDFPDMFENFLNQGRALPIKYLFLDEAQDLSRLQWRVAALLGSATDKTYIAGDDKQSIYVWGGADPEALLNLEGNREILSQSYRIPKRVHRLSETIASRIRRKCKYHFSPREEEGQVHYISHLEDLPMQDESWLLLARNTAFLGQFDDHCYKRGYLFETRSQNNGVDPKVSRAVCVWQNLLRGLHVTAKDANLVYDFMKTRTRIRFGYKKVLKAMHDDEIVSLDRLRSEFGLLTVDPWEKALDVLKEPDREYVKKVIETEGLTSSPRISINTIHSTKGQEADNVVICPDMALRSYEEFKKGTDDEHRVFYVGVTRAKKNLYILKPKTEMSYPL
jgi:DNA helicase-2/ATP-dependent DNA helicase PcrA